MPRREIALEKLAIFLLQQKYQSIAEKQDSLPEINRHEFRIYSQFGEDGILLYIFSKIGITNRCFVEFGIGDGRECNTANLSINFGWHGLLMDCDKDAVALVKHYYQKTSRENIQMRARIRIVQCLVSAGNINKVLLDNGIKGEIDLLSIDIDGNDFWVWKAITVIDPHVVVIEYNPRLGYDKPITVKYDPKFDRFKKHPSGSYYGASLAALTKLAHSKGYVLVGANEVNAFFVRKDVACGKLSEVSVKEAYYPYSVRLARMLSKQFEHIKHLDFVYV